MIDPWVYAVPTVPPYSLITRILELNSSTFTTYNCSVDMPMTSSDCKTEGSPLIEIKVTIPVVPVLPIPVDNLNIDVLTPIL